MGPRSAARASHSFEEHTGEVRVHVVAPSLAELLAEAGRALAELMTGEAAPGDGELSPLEPVSLEARDPDALLVEWLNELIYRSDVNKAIYVDFAIDEATDTRMRGRLRHLKEPPLKTAVKAATFHGLHVERREDGLAASVVLDV